MLNNKFIKTSFMLIKIITTLFVILVVSVIFVQRISNNKAKLGGYSIFTVVSESMSPVYEIGDMIIAKTVKEDEIKVHDDIVYHGERGTFKDRVVTHRVIQIETKDGVIFHTRGIANSENDPSIKYNQIYGKVLFKSKILSFLSKLMNNAYGFYFVIFIPFTIMVFLEILDFVKERKERKQTG